MLKGDVRLLLAQRHRAKRTTECFTERPTQPVNRAQQQLTIEKLAKQLTALEEDASVIIGVGYGVSPEAFTALQALAKQLHARIIGTRPAVDAGLIPHECMVGQTGISIAPTYYLAFGISGQQLHTVGIEESRYIVAINTDPEARLCQLADYIVVSDAEQAATRLLRILQTKRSA